MGVRVPGFGWVHYSLQGNHAHLIVEAQDPIALGRGMMAIGARLARAVNRIAGRSGPVLADRYHSRMLPTPREVHGALRYVLLNARKHAATAAKAFALIRRRRRVGSMDGGCGADEQKIEKRRPALWRRRSRAPGPGSSASVGDATDLLDPAAVPG
jgi:hypothetical protein